MKKKKYERPSQSMVVLNVVSSILAGSGYAPSGEKDGYGDEITDEWE